MKRLILLIFVLGTSQFMNAQDFSDDNKKERLYSSCVKLHPINLILSEFALNYEGALSRNTSISVIGGATLAGRSQIYNARNVFGFRGELQFRRYVTGKNILNGLYIAPMVYYRQIDMEYESYYYDPFFGYNDEYYDLNAFSVGGGVLLGYQVVLSDVVCLDFNIGSGIKYSKDNRSLVDPQQYYYYINIPGFDRSGTVPRGSISFGITL